MHTIVNYYCISQGQKWSFFLANGLRELRYKVFKKKDPYLESRFVGNPMPLRIK